MGSSARTPPASGPPGSHDLFTRGSGSFSLAAPPALPPPKRDPVFPRGGGRAEKTSQAYPACFPREKAGLSAAPFRSSVAPTRSSSGGSRIRRAPFWRHVRDALAERHP